MCSLPSFPLLSLELSDFLGVDVFDEEEVVAGVLVVLLVVLLVVSFTPIYTSRQHFILGTSLY